MGKIKSAQAVKTIHLSGCTHPGCGNANVLYLDKCADHAPRPFDETAQDREIGVFMRLFRSFADDMESADLAFAERFYNGVVERCKARLTYIESEKPTHTKG